MSREELAPRVKELIVRRLKLDIDPKTIDDAAPLFGEGLGLDSIDALEIVLEIERSFGVSISDEQTGASVLRSVNTIADHVAKVRGVAS